MNKNDRDNKMKECRVIITIMCDSLIEIDSIDFVQAAPQVLLRVLVILRLQLQIVGQKQVHDGLGGVGRINLA